MAHTFDTKNRTTGAANPINIAYTAGQGTTLLVVGIVVAGGVQRAGGAPTFSGVAMTQVDSTRVATETNCELWYLTNPNVSAGTILSIPNTGTLTCHVITSSYKASPGKTSILDISTGNIGAGANPSLSVTTTANGCTIVDILGHGDNNIPTGNNQILLFSTDNGGYTDNAQYALQAAAGLISMSWTVPADDWCMVVGAFREIKRCRDHTDWEAKSCLKY